MHIKISLLAGLAIVALVAYMLLTPKREGAAIPNFSDGGPASDNEMNSILPPMLAFR